MADTEHENISRQTGVALRTALQVAMQVAEALARRREEKARDAAAADTARARSLTARLGAERASAEALLRRTRDRQWWAGASDTDIVTATRLADTWRGRSDVADRAVAQIETRLKVDRGIDLAALRDTADTAAVSAMVERELAGRAARAAAAAEYESAGFTLAAEPPVGPDFVPLHHLSGTPPSRTEPLSTAGLRAVDRTVIDAAPQAWAVHVGTDPEGRPQPQFYCTDLAAAGVFRRPPVGEELWSESWLASADETQLRQIRQHLMDTLTDDPVRRLDRMILDRRDLDLGGDTAGVGHSVDDALDWAGTSAPELAHRYRADTASRAELTTTFETHHARAWAQSRDPSFAATLAGDGSANPAAIDELIARWNRAGRPPGDADPERGSAALTPTTPAAAADRTDHLAAALPWAEKNVPADVARYRSDNPKTKQVGQESILLAYDTHHARQWSTGNAPAAAVAFADAAGQPDRQTYLTARDAMIGAWNDAGRPAEEPHQPAESDRSAPTVELAAASPSAEPAATDTAVSPPTHTTAWDTPQRRGDTAAALTAAGVDDETVQAHMLADVSQAARLDATTMKPPSSAPSATPGDRGQDVDRSVDRGDR